MRECLFCNIKDRRIPSEVIDEDADTLAFLDVSPKAPGHAMVIPKKHYETIAEVPDEELGGIFRGVKRVAERLVAALGARGLTIGVNQGKAAGQVVEHLHIHLIPRFEDDGGTSIHGVVNNAPKESLEAIASRIRKGK
jgi:histidine triad (HIT) family protein